MWIDLQGSRSPTRPDLSTPIQPSWPVFHRSPSSTRYPRLSEVMKIHVFDIPIPINAEMTRCIKGQDFFHLKVILNPIISGVKLKQIYQPSCAIFLSLSWNTLFASEVLCSHFTWFRYSAGTQQPHNRLTYQRAQCSQPSCVTGMPSIWQRSINPSRWQRNKDVFVKGNSFYSTSRSIRATESTLMYRAHWLLKAAQV